MSLLRPSIASRLLKGSAPCVRRSVPGAVRFESQTALGTPLTSTTTPAVTQNNGGVEQVKAKRNQPEYTAEVDQASAYASLRVLVNGYGCLSKAILPSPKTSHERQ